LSDKYADDNDLKYQQKRYKTALAGEMKSAFPTKIGKDMAASLEIKLDRSSFRWVKINQIHKKCYSNKVRDLSTIIGTIIGGVIGTGLAVVEAIFLPGIGWVLGPITIVRGALLGAAAGHWMATAWDALKRKFRSSKQTT